MTVEIIANARDITNDLWANLDGGPSEPYSERAESGLLASLLRNNQQYDALARYVNATDFYDREHKDIWSVFQASLGDLSRRRRFEGKRQGVHVNYIRSQLEVSGIWTEEHAVKLESMSNQMIPEDVAACYAGMVVQLRRRRDALRMISTLQGFLLKPDPESDVDALACVQQLAGLLTSDEEERRASLALTIAKNLKEDWTRQAEGEVEVFVSTGIEPLDAALHGGFRNGGYTIAGLTGHGKTTFSLATMNGWLDAPGEAMVQIWSAEMTQQETAYRLFATRFEGLTEQDFQDNPYARGLKAQADGAADWLGSQNIEIFPPSTRLDVQRIMNEARAAKARKPSARLLLIIDYLQYCRCPWLEREGKSRHIEEAAETLNAFAKSMPDTTVLLLTQYKQEGLRDLPVPVQDPEQAKWARSIHDASPNFISFHRPYNGHPELDGLTVLVNGKSRFGFNGVTKCWALAWSDMDQKTFGWATADQIPAEFATGVPGPWPFDEEDAAEQDGRVEGFMNAVGIFYRRITKPAWEHAKRQRATEVSRG